MTTNVVSLKESDNLYQGRMILKENNIRHLPITTDDGQFAGLLTQKDILNNAFNVVEKYGFNKLKQREERTIIKDVLTADCPTIAPDAELKDAGQFFIDNKHSCLPVVEDKKLVGIVTSVDFVKLSMYLLNQ